MLQHLLPLLLSLATPASPACWATDGDSIRCGTERFRLLGIDAPEKGRCPRTRRCMPGDPTASHASLARAMRGRPLTITRIGHDRYSRTLALVRAGATDLSCWQLQQRQAGYQPKWDNGRRVARRCPLTVAKAPRTP